MADLHAVYQELGLPGLVPHALREGSRGREMLLNKIQSGEPLYVVQSKFQIPYLVVKDGDYQSLVFTTKEAAEQKCEQLQEQRFDVSVEELPGKEGREEAILSMFDLGSSAMLLDESLSIPLARLADTPTYDGQPNEEHVLRNRRLNGALFRYLQIACAQMSNVEAECEWGEQMCQGKFLLLVKNVPSEGYPLLMKRIRGRDYLLVYTDWRQVWMDFRSETQPDPAAFICPFEELEALLEKHFHLHILLNPPTCHLSIDADLFAKIRQIATDADYRRGKLETFSRPVPLPTENEKISAFGQISEDLWDKIDPTPDWLKPSPMEAFENRSESPFH